MNSYWYFICPEYIYIHENNKLTPPKQQQQQQVVGNNVFKIKDNVFKFPTVLSKNTS